MMLKNKINEYFAKKMYLFMTKLKQNPKSI